MQKKDKQILKIINQYNHVLEQLVIVADKLHEHELEEPIALIEQAQQCIEESLSNLKRIKERELV